jgi:hypothetical protein
VEGDVRARIIKPGFFTNEELAAIGPHGMLLFAGLWTEADRDGRLEDRPLRIKARLLPYFDCDVDALLTALSEKGFVIRYEIEGQKYLQITKWSDHQNPHPREQASQIPAFPVQGKTKVRTKTLPDQPCNKKENKDQKEKEDLGEEGEIYPEETLALAWNANAPHLSPTDIPLGAEVSTHARKRLKEHSLEEWEQIFARADNSPFLRGENGDFHATFGWAMERNYFAARVLEGRYDGGRARASPNGNKLSPGMETLRLIHEQDVADEQARNKSTAREGESLLVSPTGGQTHRG